ncbi:MULTISPECIES: flavin reductase family protein [unclassified Bacillus (in: firmicutes)]|uniref:flavin reductase family protein n=1 Tax=unclassified Bacillus (in: firmicutes) TaxID=185979 RepID=UPI00047C949C|nr:MULTISPECIES: flavin reductase family protein [unclassified Bacillus (in: firmicutes)]SDY83090.1 NADH-FMN oxidoreductase RutF, flavin reductase (DIM6/NTAB) family [Bacillus sp. 166amftsu]
MNAKTEKLLCKEIKPKILYYGMPIYLLSTLDEDGTTNISPMSSSWALGNYVILGIGLGGKSIENLERNRECVINLPSSSQWKQVEKIAPYTGLEHVPVYKQEMGYTYQKDKFALAGLTPLDSKFVKPQRIKECPLQIETIVKQIRIPEYDPFFAIVETEVVHVHAHEEIILGENHIDPQKWSPLFYNFRHYFSIGEELGKNYRAES